MKLEWISNSNHTAIADDFIWITDTGRIVKTEFFCKQVKGLLQYRIWMIDVKL